MAMAIIGVVVNLLGMFVVIAQVDDDSVGSIFIAVAVLSWLISALGLILMKVLRSAKPGAILTIIGSVIFVPAGLIAIIGARKMLRSSKATMDDLETRRQLAQAVNPADVTGSGTNA